MPLIISGNSAPLDTDQLAKRVGRAIAADLENTGSPCSFFHKGKFNDHERARQAYVITQEEYKSHLARANVTHPKDLSNTARKRMNATFQCEITDRVGANCPYLLVCGDDLCHWVFTHAYEYPYLCFLNAAQDIKQKKRTHKKSKEYFKARLTHLVATDHEGVGGWHDILPYLRAGDEPKQLLDMVVSVATQADESNLHIKMFPPGAKCGDYLLPEGSFYVAVGPTEEGECECSMDMLLMCCKEMFFGYGHVILGGAGDEWSYDTWRAKLEERFPPFDDPKYDRRAANAENVKKLVTYTGDW